MKKTAKIETEPIVTALAHACAELEQHPLLTAARDGELRDAGGPRRPLGARMLRRIALTYNEKRNDTEDEAEFDSAATIHALAVLLEGLGHVVVPVDVSCPIDVLVARLDRVRPDLVFNMAEGRRGPFREAFFPALFEELGLPHTGSSASVLALCLDKALAKRIVAAAGVATPRAQLVHDLGGLAKTRPPVIVKPNFEGSSKGITQASVVTSRDALLETVTNVLGRYADGVLVEAFVDGTDVAVGWIEGVGTLPPIGYAYEPTGHHRILDLALKQTPERVRVEVPARLDRAALDALDVAATRSFAALGVRGYGRADFRVTPDGRVRFLEMNPLPSLALEDDDLYAAFAGRSEGKTPSDLLASIVDAVPTR